MNATIGEDTNTVIKQVIMTHQLLDIGVSIYMETSHSLKIKKLYSHRTNSLVHHTNFYMPLKEASQHCDGLRRPVFKHPGGV